MSDSGSQPPRTVFRELSLARSLAVRHGTAADSRNPGGPALTPHLVAASVIREMTKSPQASPKAGYGLVSDGFRESAATSGMNSQAEVKPNSRNTVAEGHSHTSTPPYSHTLSSATSAGFSASAFYPGQAFSQVFV